MINKYKIEIQVDSMSINSNLQNHAIRLKFRTLDSGWQTTQWLNAGDTLSIDAGFPVFENLPNTKLNTPTRFESLIARELWNAFYIFASNMREDNKISHEKYIELIALWGQFWR